MNDIDVGCLRVYRIDVLAFLGLVCERDRCFLNLTGLCGLGEWRNIMGGTARQFNKMYSDYKKRFKKPIANIALLLPQDFTDDLFVNTFIELYPDLWDDLKKKYKYWHDKNNFLINHGKKSRYNFRKPYNFILDCSYDCRNKLRKSKNYSSLSPEEKDKLKKEISKRSIKKQQTIQAKISHNLYYVQEIEPSYTKAFIDKYFTTHDLHERLEIIRELSKYKSDSIVNFFYKVNACTRNFSLKQESMQYIQAVGLPFVLRRKKKGKTNFIDNEIVKNDCNPEILMQRIYVNRLEKLKEFDMFISHNSRDEAEIVDFYKKLNSQGYVAYIDWVNDKFDLKRQWCNATTAQIIKERIKQSKVFILFLSESTLDSQWCPWELGYADALGKKICIYLHGTDLSHIPQFYSSYPQLLMYNQIYIEIGGTKILFDEWIK